ncbi:MAG: CotH kinase family protein [Verrucomicrobiota bacterium]
MYQKIQGNNPDGTPNPANENLLDVPALIDYMLVILYTGNFDAPISATGISINNWYGLRDRSGQHGGFRFVLHDSENTLYNLNDDRTGPFPAGDPAQGSSFAQSNPQYLWQQLSANEEFRVLVGDHIQRHFFNTGVLTFNAISNRYQARRRRD